MGKRIVLVFFKNGNAETDSENEIHTGHFAIVISRDSNFETDSDSVRFSEVMCK